MTTSLRTIDVIGHKTEGNVVLRRLQYMEPRLDLAALIVANKIQCQRDVLYLQRTNDWALREAEDSLSKIQKSVMDYSGDVRGLMGLEGNAARIYFEQNFSNINWNGRRPRVKDTIANAVLDIGYSLLFNYIDAMVSMYGFDTYHGFLHTEFYLRKSLVCDMVEPFRPLIDWAVRKAFNLRQIQFEHFNESNGRFLLDISHNREYVRFLIKPIIEHKNDIFLYFQSFYRAFMKKSPLDKYPFFRIR